MISWEKIRATPWHQANLDALFEVWRNWLMQSKWTKTFFLSLGLTYCTLNKIHRDDLLQVLELYPDFAKSFVDRFRVTFDLRQVMLRNPRSILTVECFRSAPSVNCMTPNRSISSMMILKRSFDSGCLNYSQKDGLVLWVNPKKVSDLNDIRLIWMASSVDVLLEISRLSPLRSFRGVRKSIDDGVRRPMSTIVELSPDQAHPSSEELDFARDMPRLSLTPLAQGKTLTNTHHVHPAGMDSIF